MSLLPLPHPLLEFLYNLDPCSLDNLYLACCEALKFVKDWGETFHIFTPTKTRVILERATETATPWSE